MQNITRPQKCSFEYKYIFAKAYLMTTYHVAINGQQQGPFSLPQIEVMHQMKKIQLTDLCWTEGMAEWLPISQALPEVGAPLPEEFNPYQAPQSLPAIPLSKPKGYYGGINRITYFLFNFVLAITSVFTRENLPLTLILVVLSLAVIALRLKNIGMNGWFSLMSLIPVLNLLVAYRCIACQEGYADSQRLDGAGRVISWIFWIFITLALGIIAYGVFKEI